MHIPKQWTSPRVSESGPEISPCGHTCPTKSFLGLIPPKLAPRRGGSATRTTTFRLPPSFTSPASAASSAFSASVQHSYHTIALAFPSMSTFCTPPKLEKTGNKSSRVTSEGSWPTKSLGSELTQSCSMPMVASAGGGEKAREGGPLACWGTRHCGEAAPRKMERQEFHHPCCPFCASHPHDRN